MIKYYNKIYLHELQCIQEVRKWDKDDVLVIHMRWKSRTFDFEINNLSNMSTKVSKKKLSKISFICMICKTEWTNQN